MAARRTSSCPATGSRRTPPRPVTRAGTWAFEALRIARGEPRLGLDTDHRTIPNEVGWIGPAVHLDKGCYRGQETVARVHTLGRPPRRLTLLHLDGTENRLPPRRHRPLLHEGKVVGRVGSSARHHELGPIALALVKRNVPLDVTLDADGDAGRPGDRGRPRGRPARAPEPSLSIDRSEPSAHAPCASSALVGHRGGDPSPRVSGVAKCVPAIVKSPAEAGPRSIATKSGYTRRERMRSGRDGLTRADLEDQRVERRVHSPGMARVLELFLEVPDCPVLDDVPTPRPEQREEDLEALLGRVRTGVNSHRSPSPAGPGRVSSDDA